MLTADGLNRLGADEVFSEVARGEVGDPGGVRELAHRGHDRLKALNRVKFVSQFCGRGDTVVCEDGFVIAFTCAGRIGSLENHVHLFICLDVEL